MIDANYAAQMAFNKTHILTVARDWRENGKQYWRLLHGNEIESGFEVCDGFATRAEALFFALRIAKAAKRDSDGVALYPVVAYEHGFRKFRFVDCAHYDRTGEIRHK